MKKSTSDPTQSLRKFISSEFFRFLIVGGVNTGLSYGIYLLANLVMPYLLAYTTSTVAGIAISYVLNALFVYRTKLSLARAVAYPAVYVVQYGLGIVLLYVLVEKLGISRYLAPLIIIVVTIPISFSLSRFIVKQRVEN